MQHIEIDFEVWKALTHRREHETHSYNEVLRELLGLPILPPSVAALSADDVQEAGRTLGGRYLPNGTRLRSKYKDAWFYAEITDGRLIGENGKTYGSASAAARAVTNNNVNGLSFWEVRRPADNEWRKLLELPRLNK